MPAVCVGFKFAEGLRCAETDLAGTGEADFRLETAVRAEVDDLLEFFSCRNCDGGKFDRNFFPELFRKTGGEHAGAVAEMTCIQSGVCASSFDAAVPDVGIIPFFFRKRDIEFSRDAGCEAVDSLSIIFGEYDASGYGEFPCAGSGGEQFGERRFGEEEKAAIAAHCVPRFQFCGKHYDPGEEFMFTGHQLLFKRAVTPVCRVAAFGTVGDKLSVQTEIEPAVAGDMETDSRFFIESEAQSCIKSLS